MGKLTLIIEDTLIDFEIDQIGFYPYQIGERNYFLKVTDIHEKGCSFRRSDYSSHSYWWGMKTRPFYICSICGDLFEKSTAKGEDEHRMEKDHLCFDCALWANRADKENPLVIDGIRYSLGPGNWGGMAGRRFVIEYFDGRIVETKDLWCNGEVPDYFRDRIPDTARFLGGAHFDRDVKAWQSSQ